MIFAVHKALGGLVTNNHLSAVVKGDVEVSSDVTANNSLFTKHTNDCRMFPRISKLCNFDTAKVGWNETIGIG
jgi:hypothetical protein